MSYLERTVIGLGPATRENIRSYLVRLGGIAAEAADAPAARFTARRLSELDTRRACAGPEPLLFGSLDRAAHRPHADDPGRRAAAI